VPRPRAASSVQFWQLLGARRIAHAQRPWQFGRLPYALSPLRDGGPLVLLEVGGRRVVIDGNNRINLWRAERAPGPFEALVIVPNENAA